MAIFSLFQAVLLVGNMPREQCYLWQQELIGLHATSDAIIALAYFFISVTLFHFTRREWSVPIRKILFLLSVFTLACGAACLLEIWALWHPIYWASGGLKALIALVMVGLIGLAFPSIGLRQLDKLVANEKALKAEVVQLRDVAAALEESQLRFNSAFEYAAIGMALVSLEGAWLDVNNSLGKLVGYTAQELKTKTFQDITHPDDLATDLAYLRQMLKGERLTYQMEKRYFHKQGHIVWVSLSVSLVHNSEGKPLYFVSQIQDISARKQAEEALLQSEATNRAVFEQAGIGINQADPETGIYIRANQRFCELLDYTNDELRQLTYQEVTHPEDRDRNIEQIHQVLGGTRKSFTQEKRYIRKDGTYVWVEITVSRICSDQDHIISYLAIVQDINDRKATEITLATKTEQLDGFFSLALDLLCITSASGHFLRLNNIWEQTLGYSLSELEGTEFISYVHPDDVANTLHAASQLEAGEQVLSFINRYRCYDGSYRWIEWRSRPSGELVYSAARDVTERVQAEKSLPQLSDSLDLAIASNDIGLWDWNVRQNTFLYDQRTQELYDVDPGCCNSLYEMWADRLHGADYAAATTALQLAIEGQQDFNQELRVLQADDTVRFVRAGALIQRDAQNRPKRIIGISYDITERKRAQELVRQYAAQLKASNQELEAFAYSVSHDLRAPLRAIDGFSQALIEDYGERFDAEGQDYFDRIRKNVARMGLLIDDLLRLSRVSRSKISYTGVDLGMLAQDLMKDFQASEPERHVEFVNASTGIIQADATLMQVVLLNLLQNAWKFTSHHATARIEFGLVLQLEEPTYFVRDDGAGFDMTYANQLFGVFQRLHRADEFSGTGIGLATVQRAISRHGGRVWAESTIEEGATFYFTVPGINLERAS